jgi:hypothetical protein
MKASLSTPKGIPKPTLMMIKPRRLSGSSLTLLFGMTTMGRIYGTSVATSPMMPEVHGLKDPILFSFADVAAAPDHMVDSEAYANYLIKDLDNFLATDYPALFKVRACQAVSNGLACYRSLKNPDVNLPSMVARDRVIEAWGDNYGELIKQKYPHKNLFFLGRRGAGGN